MKGSVVKLKVSKRPVEFQGWPTDALGDSYGPFHAVCKAHIDGDTYDFLVDAGLGLYGYLRVRLLGGDTPETNRGSTRDAGLRSLARVVELMPLGQHVLLKDTRPDPDSFGRYLARIEFLGVSDLTSLLINEGLAVKMDG